MRITIVTGPWLPVPPIEGGSTGRIWQGLSEAFVSLGHQVTIVSKQHSAQPDTEEIHGVTYRRIGGSHQTGSIAIDLMKDFCYAVRTLPKLPEADITIFHDFWLPAVARFRKSQIGKTVVFVGRMPKGQFWLYKHIDHFVVASEIVGKKVLAEMPSYKDKLSLIPCPVDNTFFLDPNAVKNFENNCFLYVGRVHREKGLDLLLKAFTLFEKEHSGFSLDIVGPTDEAQGGGGQAYRKQLQDSAGKANVVFRGPEYGLDKLSTYYQEADVFIYPSLSEQGETFGIAPLEAMAAGVVPIVSDLDCFQGHIHHRRNGMVFNHRANDPAAELASCLKELLEKDSVCEQLSLQARDDAKNYTYSEIAKQYIELFQEL